MVLTENFTLEELTRSTTATQRGIKNEASAIVKENLQKLAENILQPLRNAKGAVHINCGYRSPMLNKAVGGAATSQHLLGEAADISGDDNAVLFHYIKDHLPFDQLIWEGGNNKQPAWIHVSYSNRNRKQALIMENGKYSPFKG